MRDRADARAVAPIRSAGKLLFGNGRRSTPPDPAKLRVLVVSRGVVPVGPQSGGAEVAAYQLSRHLARRGHQVSLVSDAVGFKRIGDAEVEFIPIKSFIHRLARRLPPGFFSWIGQHLTGNVSAALKAARLVRKRQFDVVHAHGNLSAILLSVLIDTPLVYTEHDAPPWHCRYRRWWERGLRTVIYQALNRQAWRSADRVGATFERLRGDLANRWNIPAERVFSIASGTDAHAFCPTAEHLGHPEVPFERYCLFVGRLTHRKAPDLLLKALAEAPGICCVFVGDGPMRPELQRLTRQLGLQQRVAFMGCLDSSQLPPIYAKADLFVLPSVSEASPIVAMEAMACGTAVLATRIAGVPAVVEDYETGFLVSPSDVGSLSVALRFLTRDRDLLAAMGEKAQARVTERYSWPVLAMEYEVMYRSLLPRRDERQIPLSPSAQDLVVGLEERRRLVQPEEPVSV